MDDHLTAGTASDEDAAADSAVIDASSSLIDLKPVHSACRDHDLSRAAIFAIEDITHTGASPVLAFAFAGQTQDLREILLRQTGPPGVIDQPSIKPPDHEHFMPPNSGNIGGPNWRANSAHSHSFSTEIVKSARIPRPRQNGSLKMWVVGVGPSGLHH